MPAKMTLTPDTLRPLSPDESPRRGSRKNIIHKDRIPTDKKQFRVWDGEGVSYCTPEICQCVVPLHPCFVRQNYVLFGYAELGTGHEYISTTVPGTYLGTEQILDFMMEH